MREPEETPKKPANAWQILGWFALAMIVGVIVYISCMGVILLIR